MLTPDAAPKRQKVEKIERTMDGIRDKFGKTAITPTRLQNKGHHERPIPPGPKRDVSGE